MNVITPYPQIRSAEPRIQDLTRGFAATQSLHWKVDLWPIGEVDVEVPARWPFFQVLPRLRFLAFFSLFVSSIPVPFGPLHQPA